MGKIQIKAKEKNGVVKVTMKISHVMMTYNQAKNKNMEANFITHIMVKAGDKIVYEISSSQFISKDPLFKFKFHGKKGEMLAIVWRDKSGAEVTERKKIK